MERLSQRIERFIRADAGTFEPLALELFAYQFQRNEPYRTYCEAQSLTPATIQRWQDIPAVPVRGFKSAPLVTFPIARAAAWFESSRTTGQIPSRHYLKDLLYYETACVKSFKQWVLPDSMTMPFLILTPPPAEAPRSSLVWMFDTVKRQCATQGDYFIQRGRLDETRLAHALQWFQEANRPVVLLGTTLAFLFFFDYCQAKKLIFALPPGSRLLDTGGMKGSQRATTRPDFVDAVRRVLGIPEDQCVNEYGMCEMSSQFYGRGKSTFLQGPPWVKTQLVGGCLRHFDLANVDSVLAIQTEDLGAPRDDGFELLGRAPQAELKGCSLMAETP